MSEFNDNRQPRRRRTQLNAAQYAGQQTLDNSIPLIRTEDAPMQPTNPPRRNPQPPPAQQSANPPMQPMSAANLGENENRIAKHAASLITLGSNTFVSESTPVFSP